MFKRTNLGLYSGFTGDNRGATVLAGSGLKKSSVVIKGHKTSITLEDKFWSGLTAIARDQGCTLRGLLARIKAERGGLLNFK